MSTRVKCSHCNKRTRDSGMNCLSTNYSLVLAHLAMNSLEVIDLAIKLLQVSYYALGWSRLSGIPDGQGGYLPAIRQSPLEKPLSTSAKNNMHKSTRIAPFMPSKSPPQSPLFPSRPSLPLVSYYIFATQYFLCGNYRSLLGPR